MERVMPLAWVNVVICSKAYCLSIRYTERLGEAEIVASVGSKGDGYDCPGRELQRSLQD